MNISEIASHYSTALIDSCSDRQEAENIYKELDMFWDFCNANKDIINYITSLFYDIKARKSIILEICSLLKLSDLAKRFIKLSFENSRMKDMGEIIVNLESKLDLMNNISRAQVFSVNPLSESEIDNVKEILIKKFSSNFIVINIIDQSLINGIKIIFNNNIIDISVYGILGYYKNCLIKEK